jgi:hypothetical protein
MVFRHALVIDERTVGAAQILDEGVFPDSEDVGVLAAHGEVIENDLAPRLAADFHIALLEIDMIDHFVVQFDD